MQRSTFKILFDMTGHTNIKTTQIYAKITKEKISQDMEILSRKLEGLEKQIMEQI